MLVRVADRFACDAISLAANDGSQLAEPALHDYAYRGFDGESIAVGNSVPSALNEVMRSRLLKDEERMFWTASRPSPIAWSPTCIAESKDFAASPGGSNWRTACRRNIKPWKKYPIVAVSGMGLPIAY